jgi:murein DD-endopeptidase MepM/ murein hydrolase activator NlpD
MKVSLKSAIVCFLKMTANFTRNHFRDFCRFTYIIGIQTIRASKRVGRRVFAYLLPIGYFLRHIYSVTLGVNLYRLWNKVKIARSGAKKIRARVKKAKQRNFFAACSIFFYSLRKSASAHRGVLSTALNFCVSVICILLLVSSIRYWKNQEFNLTLSNQGKTIGTIRDEKVFEQASELVNQRMIHGSSQSDASIQFMPAFKLTSDKSGLKSTQAVCDLLIKQSNDIIDEASGLYVDGDLIGAVKSSADLRYMLQNYLNEAKGNDKDATAKFVKNVEVINGLYPISSIISTDKMQAYINGKSSAGTTYTVKEGDTLTSIAAANNMSISDLRKLNPNITESIHPGDLIQLKVAVPTLEVEVIKTISYEGTLPYSTETKKDDSKYSDYVKVLQEGVDGKQYCVDRVHYINGIEVSRESVKRTVTKQPISKIVLTGTKKRPVNEKGVASGKFMWPLPSLHMITSTFGSRWGAFHKGIDISGSGAYGKVIVAADGGVVTLAGWNDGYGKCVIINHGNGKKTLYGHCSSLLVSAGQAVSRGQAIARVGSTGDSIGPHLHFEVIVGGSHVNPRNYVS